MTAPIREDFIVLPRRSGSTADVALHGELDIATAPILRDALTAQIDDGVTDVCLDLADLQFVDSTGLGVIVGVHRRLQRVGGTLRLRSPRPAILRVLEISGLAGVVPVD